jgi:hypothetical protein
VNSFGGHLGDLGLALRRGSLDRLDKGAGIAVGADHRACGEPGCSARDGRDHIRRSLQHSVLPADPYGSALENPVDLDQTAVICHDVIISLPGRSTVSLSGCVSPGKFAAA